MGLLLGRVCPGFGAHSQAFGSRFGRWIAYPGASPSIKNRADLQKNLGPKTSHESRSHPGMSKAQVMTPSGSARPAAGV